MKDNLNYTKLVDSYLTKADWRVAENSTVTWTLGGFILGNSGAITANYWLNNLYPEEIANLHKNCDIHIHDLSMLSGYCAGWSLKQLIQEGLGGVPGKITSSPASHLSTLCNQMVNFLGIMQNEWAGAQAFSSFDTYLAPFVKVDNLSYKEVKQCIQSFIFGVNTPSRWGTQAPFTNITLDWVVPNDLANLPCIVGGKEMDFCYRDCKSEMDMINKAFIECMIEGDANGRGFQYPIPTYSITRDFDWSETENNKLLFQMTAKYGTPYFSNYINSDMEPSDVRSMCPMTPDTEVIVRTEQNGIRIAPISTIYQNSKNLGTEYEVFCNGKWYKGNPIQTPATKVYKINFSNGASVKLGKDHLQPTRDFGTLHADELKEGMWIPFGKNGYGTDDLGSKEFGFAVGAYAGDGSHDRDAVIYSLDSREKDDKTEERLIKFWNSIGFKAYRVSSNNPSVRFVRVNGNPYDLIIKYISGDNALNKQFTNKVFNASLEFKQGLLEGLRATDGSRSRKYLYTSSLEMKKDIEYLLNGLGHKYTQRHTDVSENRFSLNPNYMIAYPERSRYGNIYDEDESYFYYTIESIEELPNSWDFLYCFEIDNEDHLFELANGLITHNCRLRLDLRELRKKSGGFFGSGESTGSVGVVTINMPRLGYRTHSKEEFFAELDHIMDLSAESLHIKRQVITELLEKGLYPYTKHYLGTFNNHFSTIGLVGMNECCLNASWIKKDLTHKEAQEFTKEVLNHMRNRLSDYQEKYGDLYNLEATPAESTSYRLAKHDKEAYPDIITANEQGTPYYTNSSHLPVTFTEDVFAALDIQDELQTLYTSGTVFHTFLGERLPNWKSCMNLVRKIAENYKLPYYTMSPTYSICPDHGYIVGEEFTCPKCGKRTEVYSRITGYYRPIQNWNEGKTQEFMDRKEYNIKNSSVKAKCPDCDIELDVSQPKSSFESDGIYLFGTSTCPNCKMAKMMLEKARIKYIWINAQENPEEAVKHHIMKAPTLVVVKDGEESRFINASEIKGWIETRS